MFTNKLYCLIWRNLFLFIVPSILASESLKSDLIVNAPAGRIKGKELLDHNGESFLSFRGIPYAQPPIGNLRFEKPQLLRKLDGIFDATKQGVECPTPALPMFSHYKRGDEDCLILNVFTKQFQSASAMKKVIVFIHGGGFVVGSSIHYLPGTFVNAHDVIFVTINYRLGILGFLSTEDEVSPGNYGLWDMVLALNWVKDNIRAFGGDPDDVTISGESAGAAAVSYLTLAPQARPLFNKAYAHSGRATSVFGRSTRANENAIEFTGTVGCQKDNSQDVIDCLKNVPLENITNFIAFTMDQSKFVPRVDGIIVPKDPLAMLNDASYLNSVGFFEKTHLVAMDNNERSIMASQVKLNEYMLLNQASVAGLDAQNMIGPLHEATTRFHIGTRLQTLSPPESMVNKIDTWYQRRYGNESLIELGSDLHFLIPTFDYIEATTKGRTCNAWLLHFNHYPEILKGHQRGIPHSFELLYWFEFPMELIKVYISNPNVEEMGAEDLKLKKLFSSVVAAFIKTGDPSMALKQFIPSKIPVYNIELRNHIDFKYPPTLASDLEFSKREFWRQFRKEQTYGD